MRPQTCRGSAGGLAGHAEPTATYRGDRGRICSPSRHSEVAFTSHWTCVMGSSAGSQDLSAWSGIPVEDSTSNVHPEARSGAGLTSGCGRPWRSTGGAAAGRLVEGCLSLTKHVPQTVPGGLCTPRQRCPRLHACLEASQILLGLWK